MQCTEGDPPKNSQRGLKAARQADGYFLACVCFPKTDLVIRTPGVGPTRYRTRVVEVIRETPLIVRLRLEFPSGYEYQAGQFMKLYRPDGNARCYSLASVPGLDDFLEIHVRRVAGGATSGWICEQLETGTEVEISEATGECCYVREFPDQPLLLVGTGSGLAPLYGVVRDALRHGHRGEIRLHHGSRDRDGIYLVKGLRAAAGEHGNFTYVPSTSRSSDGDMQLGRADELALAAMPQLKGWRVYLCGHPEMVNATRKRVFLAGASLRDIHGDAFAFDQATAKV
jgi:ferredoxin-NADP reductase